MKKLATLLVMVSALIGCGKTLTSAHRLIESPSSLIRQPLVESWSFRQVGEQNWMPATVPGTVHTDLMANLVIEDPNKSINETNLQWIEEQDWEYITLFTPSDELLKANSQELIFKGIDTYAEVYLNEELILEADNMFLEWRINVAGKLINGENRLRIRFHSATKRGAELAAQLPIALPSDNDRNPNGIKTSVFTRKAPYHFGWDWGPRYVTVGVWRPVELVGWNIARIGDVQFIQKSQSAELAEFDVHLSIEAAASTKITMMMASDTGYIYTIQEVKLTKGVENKFILPLEIPNPKLWYPNGMGEANLYPINIILSNRDNMVKLDFRFQQIGVRTIRLVQKPDSVGTGKSFYFEVNGQPCFAKGANYVPQDMFVPDIIENRYHEIITSAKESNINMLRVWGGGIYEQDLFYDLCDQNGIMVWQDFMFACALYPWDKDFLENVRREATYNVRRLRNHPSIALWCGNNEISEAWHNWGYQEQYNWTTQQQQQIWSGYKALFEGVIPQVLSIEDTTRSYHPSSPLYGRGDKRSQNQGDNHYWGVFHDQEPFSAYLQNPGRFSSEYGFQSLACYDTYRENMKPEELRLYSPAMIVHQKNVNGYRLIEQYMDRELPLLKDDFRNYVYLSQLLQAEGVRVAMEGHRTRRPHTMGSLYWQLNDPWPAASWSSIDSQGRWKALQFYARRSFAPSILSFETTDTGVKLWGVTDLLTDQQGQYSLTLMDFEGKELWKETFDLRIPANSSISLMNTTTKELLQGADPRAVVLVAQATIEDTTLRTLHYFRPLKELKLPKADYSVSYAQEGNQVYATIRANRLMKSVLFEAKALQNNPSDGYFDLLPGQEVEVLLDFKETHAINDMEISVASLNRFIGKKTATPISENIK